MCEVNDVDAPLEIGFGPSLEYNRNMHWFLNKGERHMLVMLLLTRPCLAYILVSAMY